MEFDKKLPMSPGLCLNGKGFIISVQKLKKYITTVPLGYKTNILMFFHIFRTQQKKRHAKWMIGAPRNGLQAASPQQLPCIKMDLAWLPFSINLL
jgi:hypothetical protein